MYSSQSWPNKDPPVGGSFAQSEQDARSKFRYSAKFPYRQQNTPSAPPPPTISSGSKPSHLNFNKSPASSSYLPPEPPPSSRSSTFVSSFVPVQSSQSNMRTNHKVSNARPNNIEIRVQEEVQPRSPLAQRYENENDWRNPQATLDQSFRNPDSPFDHAKFDQGFKNSLSNYENDETISKQPNREAKRNTRALDNNDPAQHAVKLDDPENFASKLRIIRDAQDGNEENESRCNLCPSPGLLREEEKDAHVHTVHFSALFQCAACYKKGFEAFDDIVVHIHNEHQVTDPQMVLETIKLPEGRDQLKIWRCGVTNCRRKFVGLSELMLKSHMHNNHGSYYLKVGKGKYIERFCRICGDDESVSFGSEQDLDHHIISRHPLEQFAPALSSDSDNGSDIIEIVRIKQEPIEKNDTPKNNLDSNNKKNVSNKQPSNKEKQKQSTRIPAGSIAPISGPSIKREKRAAQPMTSTRSPMKSPVPIFGEPLPEETNRILEETSHLIKDHPLHFEEQKRRILGDSLFEGSNRELYDKNTKPTFGEPIAENFTTAQIPRSVEKQGHDTAPNGRAIIRSADQLPPPISARSQLPPPISTRSQLPPPIKARRSITPEKSRLPPPIRARRSRTPEKSRKVAQKRKSRKSSTSSSSSSDSSNDSRSPSPKHKKVKQNSKESLKKKAVQPSSTKNIPSKLFSNAINQVEQQQQSPRANKNKVSLPDMSTPKFMLDGRPAYYICELCQEPVGTVFSWIRHRTKRKSHLALYTKEYSKNNDIKEASVSSNPSVLEKFGDKSKKCLACDTNFANNNDLRVHEDEHEHKSKLVEMELKDIAELKSSGEAIKTLFHCDMCDQAVDHPKTHVKEYSHMAKLIATKRCYYCPKRFSPLDMHSHITQYHSKNLFKCTICATTIMSKAKMLEHIKTHQKHLFSKTHEELTIYTLPSDLRKIKCGICSQGVFMSQETSEAMNHVIDEHPQVPNVAKAIKFGCQACPQLSFENDDVMNKHVRSFHDPLRAPPKTTERGFHDPMRVSPKPKEKSFTPALVTTESQKEKVAQKLNHYYVTRKVPESNSGAPVQNSSTTDRMEKNSDRTLFVGGLSLDTQDLDLKHHFEQWGKLTDYTVKQGTYRSRCFGFVTFAREEDLDKCIECREHWIKDVKITVGQSKTCWKGENPNQSPRKMVSSRSPRRSRSRPRKSSRSPRRSRSRQRRPSRSPRRSRSRQRRSSRSPRRSRSRQRRSSRSPRRSRSRERRNSRSLSRSRSRQRRNSRSPRRSRSRQRRNSRSPRRSRSRQRRSSRGKRSPERDESMGEKRIIHMRKSTDIPLSEGDFSCPLCQEGFSSQDTVVAHMKWRHSNQMFQCEMCHHFSGWNRESLQDHLASVHRKNISMPELLRNYTLIPSRLHRINCKLCQPPHLLGSRGFWIGSNLTANMKSVSKHFSETHSIQEESTVTSMLELACRGCDVTYSPGDRYDWEDHVRTDHSRPSAAPQSGRGQHSRSSTASKDTGKKCDYCKETVTASDSIRHIREHHSEETFLCKICLSADKNCFPFFDKMKEMMSHMVLKHGNEFSSYYDHIIYPKNLGWMRCTVTGCETRGKFSAYNRDLLKDHGLFFHSGIPDRKFMAIHCRNCDGVKDQFEDDAQLRDHIELKHKQIVAWKAKNGHN